MKIASKENLLETHKCIALSNRGGEYILDQINWSDRVSNTWATITFKP